MMESTREANLAKIRKEATLEAEKNQGKGKKVGKQVLKEEKVLAESR